MRVSNQRDGVLTCRISDSPGATLAREAYPSISRPTAGLESCHSGSPGRRFSAAVNPAAQAAGENKTAPRSAGPPTLDTAERIREHRPDRLRNTQVTRTEIPHTSKEKRDERIVALSPGRAETLPIGSASVDDGSGAGRDGGVGSGSPRWGEAAPDQAGLREVHASERARGHSSRRPSPADR